MRPLFIAGLLCAPAFAAAAQVTLRSTVLVDHPRILLRDVAQLAGADAAQAGAIELGRAPRIGYPLVWTSTELADVVRRRGGGAHVWDGAQRVEVHTAAQVVAGTRVRDVALAALQAVAGPDAQAQVREEVGDAEVPAGPLELRARRVHPAALGPRTTVWVDLVVDNSVYRSLVVPVTVEGRLPAQAGVKRGTPVLARLVSGAVRLERPAVALADAAPGLPVKVLINGATEPVRGRVADDGTVQIDGL